MRVWRFYRRALGPKTIQKLIAISKLCASPYTYVEHEVIEARSQKDSGHNSSRHSAIKALSDFSDFHSVTIPTVFPNLNYYT